MRIINNNDLPRKNSYKANLFEFATVQRLAKSEKLSKKIDKYKY